MRESSYPPISDYAYISDCHSSALISRSGSIDWCCMPRVDSPSCFGRLLGWEQGGYVQIAPSAPYEVSRRYLEQSLVLETVFSTGTGRARLLDCLPMRQGGEHHPYRQLLRIVEGLDGFVGLSLDLVPRFDYGAVKPWIRGGQDRFTAVGGCTGLFITGNFGCVMRGRHAIVGKTRVEKEQRAYLSILFTRPEDIDEGLMDVPTFTELDRRLEETIAWWQEWSSGGLAQGPYADQILRSAAVIKGLTNAPTGAIAAAPTTSLPESPGGSLNWDYRFSWIRDSTFCVRALAELGHGREADGFRRYVERAAAGSAEEVQVLFGVGGERRLKEQVVEELEGYRGARPVRIGNAAEGQTQLDVYGELLILASLWHALGHSPDDDYWEFLVELVNHASRVWRNPDQGIWEIRGAPRHFVQSKVMCWAALDRGIRLAMDLGRAAPVDAWARARDDIRREVEEKGYDRDRGVFIQAFEHKQSDAALLLLPVSGFVACDDERMMRTVDAIMSDLMQDGLVLRYQAGDDGGSEKEGVFLACSFWLAECLARQGRVDEAHRLFRRALATGNDLGLFAEEYDTETGEMLGNFPQGLTHLSLITAALALGGKQEPGD